MTGNIHLLKKDAIVLCFCAVFVILSIGAIAGGGRHHAQSIICQTNLKHLGDASLMYANDNDGKLYEYNLFGGMWVTPISDYIGNMDNLRHCPSTSIRNDFNNNNSYSWGNSKQAWIWNMGTDEPEHGSYAFNSWFFTFPNGPSGSHKNNYFLNISSVQFPANTPILADSVWIDSGPRDTDTCPPELNLNGNPNLGGRMSMHLINRHYDKINVSFIDGHVGVVELKELWSLTWYNSWRIKHDMTREDGSPIYRIE